MEEVLRGFRYQTGEEKEFMPVLMEKGIISADVDFLHEIDIYINILKKYGLTFDDRIDFDAVDKVENPEFYARYTFRDKDGKKFYIDIYHIEPPDETYDSVDLG